MSAAEAPAFSAMLRTSSGQRTAEQNHSALRKISPGSGVGTRKRRTSLVAQNSTATAGTACITPSPQRPRQGRRRNQSNRFAMSTLEANRTQDARISQPELFLPEDNQQAFFASDRGKQLLELITTLITELLA